MSTTTYLKELFDLSGKTAVVIGGTGELCGSMAVGLARAGAEVVLGGRIPEKAEKRLAEIESYGGKGYFVPVDVTSRQSLHDLLETVLEKSGGVDILINGAGTNSPTPFLEITEEEYSRIIDTNLTSIFRACQVFGQYFVDDMRPASIINLGSIAWRLGLPDLAVYQMAKAGVEGMTRGLARDLGGGGVRVTCIAPGNVKTPRQELWYSPEAEAEILALQCIKGRIEPSDVAAMAMFLASDGARFCTGHTYLVDAGWS